MRPSVRLLAMLIALILSAAPLIQWSPGTIVAHAGASTHGTSTSVNAERAQDNDDQATMMTTTTMMMTTTTCDNEDDDDDDDDDSDDNDNDADDDDDDRR